MAGETPAACATSRRVTVCIPGSFAREVNVCNRFHGIDYTSVAQLSRVVKDGESVPIPPWARRFRAG
ncbi:hypothetical protein GCM10022377_27270 [Zhihengliuella alba]|uniref:Uncharacterized protein n=1 Tax=Zhihengliuella alba TaxID=547018 RepID=A0ABP7E4U9_9MICC